MLEKFSEQAGVQIVYMLGEVRGVITNPVQGAHAIREALDRLVARTALRVEVEGKTGAYVIKRERTPQSPTPLPPVPSAPQHHHEKIIPHNPRCPRLLARRSGYC